MSVEHVFPSETLKVQSPLEISLSRSDAVTWRTPYGPFGGRNFAEYPIHSLKIDLGDYGSAADAASTLYWWDHHIGGPTKAFWLLEPVSRRHRAVVCGPERGDGTQTVFAVPVEATGTINAIFVNGVWQPTTAYTVYTAANQLANNMLCNGEDGVTGLSVANNASAVASITYLARMGRSAIKVTCGAAASESNVYSTVLAPPIVIGGIYSFGASFYLTGSDASVEVEMIWRDDVGGTTGTTTFANASVVPGVWTDVYGTSAAVPALTVEGRLYATKVTQSASPFFIGARWFSYGACSTRPKPFLPSYSPQCIVFAAAPAANARVTADFTGQRLWYGARDGDYVSYSVVDTGAVTMGGFKMTEVVPL